MDVKLADLKLSRYIVKSCQIDSFPTKTDSLWKNTSKTARNWFQIFCRSIVQRDFWILHSKKLLKIIIRQCLQCLPCQIASNGEQLPLPRDKLWPHRALRNNERRFFVHKIFVLFLTCLVTRAVFTEI